MKKHLLLFICLGITVMLQAQVSKEITVSAGNLASALTESEMSSVAILKVKGFIDARDFRTMRNSMTALTDLDLSEATINTFTGPLGTYYWFPNSDYYYPYNEIPIHAFKGYSSLRNIKLPLNAKVIGEDAFIECANLTGIVIPEGVSTISKKAFYGCELFQTIKIPASVTTIGDGVFTRCSAAIDVDAANSNYSSVDGVLFNKSQDLLIHYPLKREGAYTIPSTVMTIGNSSFLYCNNLTGITIPSSVTTFDYYAFDMCQHLASISVANSVPILIPGAFMYVNRSTCTLNVPRGSVSAYRSADVWKEFTTIQEMPGLYLSTDNVVFYKNESTKQIEIGSSELWTSSSDQSWLTILPASGIIGNDTIEIIAEPYLSINSRKAVVTFHATGFVDKKIEVTQFGDIEVSAGGLKAILGDYSSSFTTLSLKGTIDARDFKTMRDEMPLVTEIDLSGVEIAAYSGNEGTQSGSYTYPSKAVPAFAFYNGNGEKIKLTKVILPPTAEVIGSSAFQFCSKLIDLKLPDLLKTIEDASFKDCSSLKSIILPTSLAAIGASAFANCTGLTSITIPSSVLTIGYIAFSEGSAMVNVDFNNPNYSSINGVLFNKEKTTLFYCPVSKTGFYKMPSTVTAISDYAFSGCNLLTSVLFPDGLTTIVWYAFNNCTTLKSLKIPASVTNIHSNAFFNCSGLRSISAQSMVPIDLSSVQDPEISRFPFPGVNKDSCILYVPHGTKTAYQSAIEWKDFKTIQEINDNNLEINYSVHNGETTCFNANDTITVAGGGNSVVFDSGASIELIAGKTIHLLSGFHAMSGSYLYAHITTDGTFCGGKSGSIVENVQQEKSIVKTDDLKTELGIGNEDQIKLYPNPNNGSFTIEMKNFETDADIVVYNGTGSIIYSMTSTNTSYPKVNLPNVNKGIYYVRITGRGEQATRKIIVK
jgi:hypothetical protein